MTSSTGLRCPRCLSEIAAVWTFCPACGTAVERPERSSLEADELALQALRLLGQGYVAEAEALLVPRLDGAGPDAHLVYARMLAERNDFPGARVEFDRALNLAPDSFMVRVRRTEFFARYGLYNEALADAEAARKLAPDVGSLLHVQDVERRLAERMRGSFIVSAQLPSAPRWLRSLYKHIKRPAAHSAF